MCLRTHMQFLIDTNKRNGIIPGWLRANRKIGIDLRNEYSSLYPLRREIEHTFSLLEEIMKAENIWYTNNRECDTAIGLKTIAYNLMVISNRILREKRSKIMKMVIS